MLELIQKYDDFFLVNTYFEKYKSLIEANKNTKKERFKTQTHHIVPRAYFKHKCIDLDNSKENKVELTHKDHIMAHFYLSKCCEDIFIYSNLYAMMFMLNKFNMIASDLSEEGMPELADEYDSIYSDFCKRQSLMKMGHIPWNKGVKNCFSEDTIRKIKASLTGRKDSYETRKKKSNSLIGKNVGGCYVNDGKRSIHIKDDELEGYLNQGYARGQIQEHTKDWSKTTFVNNGELEKRIDLLELDSYLTQGWHKGRLQSTISKISKSKCGKVSWNKGIGWTEEREKSFVSPFCTSRYWITNGLVTKRVLLEEVQGYLDQGFRRGMK